MKSMTYPKSNKINDLRNSSPNRKL